MPPTRKILTLCLYRLFRKKALWIILCLLVLEKILNKPFEFLRLLNKLILSVSYCLMEQESVSAV